MLPPRVAVLEDEDQVRAVWLEALEEAGYAVEGFGDGAALLARVRQTPPDLILLDMMMPGMDGFEFLARLRANPHSAGIPLLIISAIGESLDMSIDEDGARTLGVAAILPKPLNLPTLIEHVERIVGPARR
jgi:CheY-like chemotaxis protein